MAYNVLFLHSLIRVSLNPQTPVFSCKPMQRGISSGDTHTGKATKGKVQDIGEVNKVMPLPLPSSVG